MPLNSPEDYARLGEHLEEIDDVWQRFLSESGYSENTGALGRYPHRSAVLVLDGGACRKIDLQMETGSDGQRFDEFFPDIPYSLWAGAWLDEGGVRYRDRGFLAFEHLPYSRVRQILPESLAQAAQRIARATVLSLKESTTRSALPSS
jgi:hypothetical protein